MEKFNANALREEFATLNTATEQLVTASASRELTAEEKATSDKNFARMEAIKATLDADKRLAGLAFAADKAVKAAEMPGKAEHEVSITVGETYSDGKKIDREQFAKSVNQWAKTGEMDRRFATITTATQSGFMLPKEVGQPLTPNYINTFRDAHSKLGIEVFKTVNTADFSMPVLDSSAGGVVNENQNDAVDGTADGAPGTSESFSLTVKTYQSKATWFSNQQLAAVDFDLFSATLPQLGFAKELGLEAAIVAAMKADSNITQAVTLATGPVTFAKLVALSEALPKRYQLKKFIVLGKQAYSDFHALTSTAGQPIMTYIDPQNQQVLNLQGTPVLRSDYFDDYGTNKVIGAVVSLIGFRLRDAGSENVARYVNFPGRPNQSGFNLFGYHGYGYAPSAVALLKTTST